MTPVREFSIGDPYSRPGVFLSAQLHAHSNRSFADIHAWMRPEEVLERYRDAGFSFVALTDHNKLTAYSGLNDERFLAITGVEETVGRRTRLLGPHLLRIGVRSLIGEGTIQERLNRTRDEGGISVLSHPSWRTVFDCGQWTVDEMRALEGSYFIEIAHPHSATDEDVHRWAAVLRTRTRRDAVGGIASDDAHRPSDIGRRWIMVKVTTITENALHAALANFSFYATTGPAADLSVLGGSVRCSGELRKIEFIDQMGVRRAVFDGSKAEYEAVGDEGFIRVEGWDGSARVWSQPFWLEV